MNKDRVVTGKERQRSLGEERLSTAAGFLYVGIVEDKLGTQTILLPVHLTANNAEQCLAVNQDLYTTLLDPLVESTRFFGSDVFEMV